MRERVLETIQRKVEGQDITQDIVVEGGRKVIDLMEALKASLTVSSGSADKTEKKRGQKVS